MGKYEVEKDSVLHCYDAVTENGKLKVTVHQYNGGVKKVQITRVLVSEAGVESFVKLGRLTNEDLGLLVPLLQSAQATFS